MAEMEQDGINPNERLWYSMNVPSGVTENLLEQAIAMSTRVVFLAVQPPRCTLWPSHKFPELTIIL